MSDLAAVMLALSAAVGAVVARPLPLWTGVVVIAIAFAVRRPSVLCLGTALVTSALAATAWAGLRAPPPRPVTAIVTLTGDPDYQGGAARAIVRLGRRHVQLTARGAAGRVLLERLAGERVDVSGRIGPVPQSVRARLAVRHVAVELTARQLVAAGQGSQVSRAANRVRRTLVSGAASMPAEQRTLFTGFVLGDDRGQSIETVDDFRQSGLSHLLVVSGENVAFVLAVAAPLLRRFGLRWRLAAGMVVLAGFGVITRWEPSVLRAEAMAAIALLAGTLGRPVSSIRLLALAVTGLIVCDPFLVRSVSFLLSVGASAGIALLARPLTDRLPGPRPLASAVAVTLAAQAGVAPVLVPAFGPLPVATLPANLLAMPAAGPVMMWGLVGGLVAGVVGGPVATLIHLPTRLLVGWIALVARTSATVPLGHLGIGSLVALTAFVVLAVVTHRRHRAVAATAVVAAIGTALAPGLALALGPAGGRAHDAGTEITRGARLWRAGGTAALVVDRPSPTRLLGAVRRHGVTELAVLVVDRGASPQVRAAIAPLLDRVPAALVITSEKGRFRNAFVPDTGAVITAGPFAITVESVKPQLRVTVARAPPTEPDAARGRFAVVRLSLGPRTYDVTTRSLVMGVLNRTTDSFFDKGAYFEFDAFLRRAEQLVADGADLLDVGGVKAGPGPEVGEQEEIDRVIPAVEALVKRFDIPLSVDTWRANVARLSFDCGAVVGNDISGFADPDYLPVAAAAGATVVATHIRLRPRVPDPEPEYDDVVIDVSRFLVERARRAEAAGIPPDRVVIDAGLDLGKTWEQSLVLLRSSARLASLGYPLLLSASNKTFLGRFLELEIDQRRDASLAAAALGVAKGCRIVRAHDVLGTRRVCDTIAAVLEAA